jgi:hypothetical protein
VHEETELLVNAIEALKQEPNYIKDYIFPIASALFTSVLGAGIAFFTLRHQEEVQFEKDKMNNANKWTLKIEEARASLIAIKGNYNGQLLSDPFQRISAIPTILFHAQPIAEDYQDLSFIVPKKDEEPEKWSQITQVRAMVSNYNYILKLWEQRNDINQAFKEKLLQAHGNNAHMTLSINDVIHAVGRADVVILIDLNERVIKLTDDLIRETDDFLSKFPKYAKSKIKHKRLKKYGSVLTYSNNDNKKLLEIIERSPEVDFSTVEDLFGSTSDEIKKRHETGYEQI